MTHETSSADDSLVVALAPTLALLATLAETGSLTRAAEALSIPQPTASRRVAALARLVGAPLTVPDGRGVRLTRPGLLLGAAAGQALNALEPGARAVAEEISPDRGHVVLGFLHLLGRALVPGLLRGYLRERPGVRFSLVQGSRQDMLDRLARGVIDLSLVAPVPAAGQELGTAVLTEEELFLSVPRAHRLAGRDRVRVAELADEDWVMLEPGYGLRQIVDRLCAEAGFRPRVAFEGQESDTVRGLVAAGLGVALLTGAGPGALAGVRELPIEPAVGRTVGLVWRAGEPATPAVAGFREFVLAQSDSPA